MPSSNTLYSIPNSLLDTIKVEIKKFNGNKKTKGYIAAFNMLNNRKLSFSNLKKIKHEYEQSGEITRKLLGGEKMYVWIDTTLKQKSRSEKYRKIGKDRAGLDNAYRKSHTKSPSLKPKFINSSFKIIINESILNEFDTDGFDNQGSEGQIKITGNYVIKTFYDLNRLKKKRVKEKIDVHVNMKNEHLIDIKGVKDNGDNIQIYYEKLLPIKIKNKSSLKEIMEGLWYDFYYQNGKEWDIKSSYEKIDDLSDGDFNVQIKTQMKSIIATHSKLNKELKRLDDVNLVDSFFPGTGDNIMQDSKGTWKIIDF